MKKILFGLIGVILLGGCTSVSDLENTPTKRVEEFLNKYQMLDASVVASLNNVVAEEINFNTVQRDRYRELVKKSYQKLTYEIKDETVNGDNAIVMVEIEVVDLAKVINEAEIYYNANPDLFMEQGVYSQSKYVDYRLGKLEEASDIVKYTLNLTVTKTNDKWVLDKLSETDLDKINGIYKY